MIALSLLTFAPGRLGGSETYVRGLTAALHEHGAREYLVVLPPGTADAAGGLVVVEAGAAPSVRRPVAFGRAALARGVFGAAAAVHYPLTVPLPRPDRPHVVTLHDLLHLDMPQAVPRRVRLFRRAAYDGAARRADRVIAPSEFVRDRAATLLGVDPARIHVVHHAVDTDVFQRGEGEREPFLLYPARPWPHKNHALLFDAFARVRRARPDLELVLTGGGVERLPPAKGIRALGAVPLETLASLYRRAAVLAFPSLHEGFGLPVLEAFASGCPAVAVAGTAVEEIAAGGPVTFTKPRPEAFADALLAAVADPDPRVAAGVELARSFTWECVARGHDAVYAELD